MFKELTVSEWRQEIESALEFRNSFGLESKWFELEALFYNVHNSQASAVPNLLMSMGDAFLSAMSVPYPQWSVQARDQRAVSKSKILEGLFNDFLYSLEIPQEVAIGLVHCFLYGKAIWKLGYDSEFGWSDSLDLGRTAPGLDGMSMSQHDKKQWFIEFNNIHPGMPWVAAVPPHDFLVPWGTPPNLERAPWAVHRVCRHIDDVRSDPKYANTKKLQPVMSREDWVKSYHSPLKPYRMGASIATGMSSLRDETNCAEYCELWEIHDKRTGKILVIATGHDKFLRNEPDLLQTNGLPFVAMSVMPQNRTFWTTPDAYLLRAIQAEMTDITIQAQRQRRLTIPKFLYNRGWISDQEMQKALSGKAGAGIPFDNVGDQSLANGIQLMPTPSNVLVYQEAQNTERNARSVIGMSSNQSGEFDRSTRRTASEAMIVQQNSMQRMSRRQIELRNAYTTMFKKLGSIIFTFWKTPRTAQILDPRGQSIWTQYTGEDLRADYSYRLNFLNEPPVGMQQRKMEAMQLYATMVQDPTVDPVQLRRYLADAMNDPAFNSIFKPGVLDGTVPPEAYQAQAEATQQQLGEQFGASQSGGPGAAGSPQGLLPPGGTGE